MLTAESTTTRGGGPGSLPLGVGVASFGRCLDMHLRRVLYYREEEAHGFCFLAPIVIPPKLPFFFLYVRHGF